MRVIACIVCVCVCERALCIELVYHLLFNSNAVFAKEYYYGCY